MEPKKYEYIDSLRGIAILMAIFGHAGYIGSKAFEFYPDVFVDFIKTIGGVGIKLFFIVSAFTLMMSHENRKNEKNATLNFFIRRFFRIAPMYYLAIIVFSFWAIGFKFVDANWADLPKRALVTSVLFINGFFPSTLFSYIWGGWSVAVEFMFYFMLPFLVRWIKDSNSTLIYILVTLLLATFLNHILIGSILDKNGYLYYYIFNHLPVFGLGMLAYWIKVKKTNIKPITLLLIALIILFYCYVDIVLYFPHALAAMLLMLTLGIKPFKLFSNRLLAAIGKVSFSLYLTHFMVMLVLGHFNIFSYWPEIIGLKTGLLHLLLTFIALTGIGYFVSIFTFKFIEVPGQNLGKKIINKLNN